MNSRAALIRKRYTEGEILQAAEQIMLDLVKKDETAYTDPFNVKCYLRFKLGAEQREHFGVMFLDAQHRLIAFEVLFSGTLTQTSVYPREVVKRALQLNAAAIILAHNHPSGVAEPSRADEMLTKNLKDACWMVGVNTLDHIVVSNTSTVSFAERGLI